MHVKIKRHEGLFFRLLCTGFFFLPPRVVLRFKSSINQPTGQPTTPADFSRKEKKGGEREIAESPPGQTREIVSVYARPTYGAPVKPHLTQTPLQSWLLRPPSPLYLSPSSCSYVLLACMLLQVNGQQQNLGVNPSSTAHHSHR